MLALGQVSNDPPWVIYDLHTDHLGTVRAITNREGGLVSRHSYFPFGEEIPSEQPSYNTHRYTGHEHDHETGLDYMLARYYEAVVGRFISVDPSRYGVRERNPQTWNRYAYANDDPIRSFDPDGLSSLTFDGASHTLTLFDKLGKQLGSWTAYNNVAKHDSKGHPTRGKWEDGTYVMQDKQRPNKHGGNRDTLNGSYGTHGIFRAEPFTQSDGQDRDNMGVHSGRQNSGGPQHPTEGCIRTTEAAMAQIDSTAANDPLQTITVENNKATSPHAKGDSEHGDEDSETYDAESTLPHQVGGDAYVKDGAVVHP
jgi:RHS repeat-associated protein